jgi:hypothetical protein
MPAPVLPTFVTSAARKVLAGLRAKFTGRPAGEAEAPLGEPGGAQTVSQSGHVTNQMSGTAHKVVQAGDIHGDVRF